MHGKFAAALLTVGIAIAAAAPAQAQTNPQIDNRPGTISIEMPDTSPGPIETGPRRAHEHKNKHQDGTGGDVTTTYDLHENRARTSAAGTDAASESAGTLADVPQPLPLSWDFHDILISSYASAPTSSEPASELADGPQPVSLYDLLISNYVQATPGQ